MLLQHEETKTKNIKSPMRENKIKHDLSVLRQSACSIDLGEWAKLSVTGADRVSFLHGMVSNDVKGLNENSGNYTLFLNAKGKIQADLQLYKRKNDVLLLAPANLHDALLTGLNKYLIMDDVEIHDRSDRWSLFALLGPSSAQMIERVIGDVSIPPEWSLTQWEKDGIEGCIMHTQCFGETGFFIMSPQQFNGDMRQRLLDAGVRSIDSDAVDVLRIENGIPLCGMDITEGVIPQEALLQHALNFKKGCYIGQEVVARLHFRGHVNRELTGFFLQVKRIPKGDSTLILDGREVGTITSACYSPTLEKFIGLGFLRCEHRTEGAEISAINSEGDFISIVTQIPFSQ